MYEQSTNTEYISIVIRSSWRQQTLFGPFCFGECIQTDEVGQSGVFIFAYICAFWSFLHVNSIENSYERQLSTINLKEMQNKKRFTYLARIPMFWFSDRLLVTQIQMNKEGSMVTSGPCYSA